MDNDHHLIFEMYCESMDPIHILSIDIDNLRVIDDLLFTKLKANGANAEKVKAILDDGPYLQINMSHPSGTSRTIMKLYKGPKPEPPFSQMVYIEHGTHPTNESWYSLAIDPETLREQIYAVAGQQLPSDDEQPPLPPVDPEDVDPRDPLRPEGLPPRERPSRPRSDFN